MSGRNLSIKASIQDDISAKTQRIAAAMEALRAKIAASGPAVKQYSDEFLRLSPALSTVSAQTGVFVSSQQKMRQEIQYGSMALGEFTNYGGNFVTSLDGVARAADTTGVGMGALANHFKTLESGGSGLMGRLKELGGAFKENALGLTATATTLIALKDNYRDLADTTNDLRAKTNSMTADQISVKEAMAEVNQLAAEGKAGSMEYAEAQEKLALEQARLVESTEDVRVYQEKLANETSQFYLSLLPTAVSALANLQGVYTSLQGSGITFSGTLSKIGTGFKSLGSSITNVIPALKGVGTAMTAIGLSNPFFIAITAAAGIFTAFVTNAFGVRDAINGIGEAIGNAFPLLKPALQALGMAGDMVVKAFGGVTQEADAMAQGVGSAIDKVGSKGDEFRSRFETTSRAVISSWAQMIAQLNKPIAEHVAYESGVGNEGNILAKRFGLTPQTGQQLEDLMADIGARVAKVNTEIANAITSGNAVNRQVAGANLDATIETIRTKVSELIKTLGPNASGELRAALAQLNTDLFELFGDASGLGVAPEKVEAVMDDVNAALDTALAKLEPTIHAQAGNIASGLGEVTTIITNAGREMQLAANQIFAGGQLFDVKTISEGLKFDENFTAQLDKIKTSLGANTDELMGFADAWNYLMTHHGGDPYELAKGFDYILAVEHQAIAALDETRASMDQFGITTAKQIEIASQFADVNTDMTTAFDKTTTDIRLGSDALLEFGASAASPTDKMKVFTALLNKETIPAVKGLTETDRQRIQTMEKLMHFDSDRADMLDEYTQEIVRSTQADLTRAEILDQLEAKRKELNAADQAAIAGIYSQANEYMNLGHSTMYTAEQLENYNKVNDDVVRSAEAQLNQILDTEKGYRLLDASAQRSAISTREQIGATIDATDALQASFEQEIRAIDMQNQGRESLKAYTQSLVDTQHVREGYEMELKDYTEAITNTATAEALSVESQQRLMSVSLIRMGLLENNIDLSGRMKTFTQQETDAIVVQAGAYFSANTIMQTRTSELQAMTQAAEAHFKGLNQTNAGLISQEKMFKSVADGIYEYSEALQLTVLATYDWTKALTDTNFSNQLFNQGMIEGLQSVDSWLQGIVKAGGHTKTFEGTIRKMAQPFMQHIPNAMQKSIDEVQLFTEAILGSESAIAEVKGRIIDHINGIAEGFKRNMAAIQGVRDSIAGSYEDVYRKDLAGEDLTKEEKHIMRDTPEPIEQEIRFKVEGEEELQSMLDNFLEGDFEGAVDNIESIIDALPDHLQGSMGEAMDIMADPFITAEGKARLFIANLEGMMPRVATLFGETFSEDHTKQLSKLDEAVVGFLGSSNKLRPTLEELALTGDAGALAFNRFVQSLNPTQQSLPIIHTAALGVAKGLFTVEQALGLVAGAGQDVSGQVFEPITTSLSQLQTINIPEIGKSFAMVQGQLVEIPPVADATAEALAKIGQVTIPDTLATSLQTFNATLVDANPNVAGFQVNLEDMPGAMDETGKAAGNMGTQFTSAIPMIDQMALQMQTFAESIPTILENFSQLEDMEISLEKTPITPMIDEMALQLSTFAGSIPTILSEGFSGGGEGEGGDMEASFITPMIDTMAEQLAVFAESIPTILNFEDMEINADETFIMPLIDTMAEQLSVFAESIPEILNFEGLELEASETMVMPMIDTMAEQLSTFAESIPTLFESVPSEMESVFSEAGSSVESFSTTAGSALQDVQGEVAGALSTFKSFSKEVGSQMSSAASKASSAASSIASSFGKIGSAASSAASQVKGLASAMNSLKDKTVTLTTRFKTVGSPAKSAAQHGTDMIVTSPHQILVGEQGKAERVTVTPLTNPDAAGDLRLDPMRLAEANVSVDKIKGMDSKPSLAPLSQQGVIRTPTRENQSDRIDKLVEAVSNIRVLINNNTKLTIGDYEERILAERQQRINAAVYGSISG